MTTVLKPQNARDDDVDEHPGSSVRSDNVDELLSLKLLFTVPIIFEEKEEIDVEDISEKGIQMLELGSDEGNKSSRLAVSLRKMRISLVDKRPICSGKRFKILEKFAVVLDVAKTMPIRRKPEEMGD
ncbi:hypothetical protein RB195_004561 [Necator americanus]|uniref:Uncharacterized protein n=1 Tax=Necator americanus TaxID=51031 RepID=A0ABR1BKM4_NECAM